MNTVVEVGKRNLEVYYTGGNYSIDYYNWCSKLLFYPINTTVDKYLKKSSDVHNRVIVCCINNTVFMQYWHWD